MCVVYPTIYGSLTKFCMLCIVVYIVQYEKCMLWILRYNISIRKLCCGASDDMYFDISLFILTVTRY